MSTRTIFASDPGSTNYGLAVVQARSDNGFKYRVLYSGMLQSPIKDLKDVGFQRDLRKFMTEIKRLIDHHKPHDVVAERFMNRGVRNSTGEKVNMMLGSLMFYAMAKQKNYGVYAAASWKTKLNSVLDMKEFVRLAREQGVSNHELDATCIGLYHASQILQLDFHSVLNSLTKQVMFISQVRKAKQSSDTR